MQLNRDFQEYLNKELLDGEKEGINNKYYKALLEALEQKEKINDSYDMQKIFNESVLETNKNSFSGTNSEVDEKGEKLLGEDDLIVGGNFEENIDETEEEIDLPDGVEDISDEELEEKYPGDELSINAKKYAFRYEKIMEQYYKLKLDLEKQNIKKGRYSYDDKYFTQLMNLKSVAIKNEIYFRNATSKKYYAVRDAIDSIKDLEEKNEIELNRYQDENNRMHERQNVRVDDVVKQIEDCLKRIEELNEEMKHAREDEKVYILHELSQVQEKYIELNKKLEMIRPNPKELAYEEIKSKSQNDIEAEVDGIHYTKYVNRYADESIINNPKYNRKEKEREEKEEELDSKIGTSKSLDDTNEGIVESKKEFQESINKEIDNGNLDNASRLVGAYVETYGKDFYENDKKEIESIYEIKKKIDDARKNNPLGDRVKESERLAEEDANSPEIMKELEELSEGKIVSERQKDISGPSI